MIAAKTSIDKNKVKKLISESVYGCIPKSPEHLRWNLKSELPCFAAGKSVLRDIDLIYTVDGKERSFPIKLTTPVGDGKRPTFIYLGFDASVPDKFLPAEEIAERGYAVFSLCASDVSDMSKKFGQGIEKHISKGKRKKSSPGRIAVWAWALLRVLEFALHQPFVDTENVAVIAHGIAAKAATLAAGYDERIKYTVINCSSFDDYRLSLDYQSLYCTRFLESPRKDSSLLTLSLCSGRHIIIGAACEDCTSDRKEEQELICSLGEICDEFYISALADKEIECESASLYGDKIFYRIREGLATLGRGDWNAYMDYIDQFVR